MPLMAQALHDYIFKLGNPYAKLSIPEALEQPKLWKTSAEFFGFLAINPAIRQNLHAA